MGETTTLVREMSLLLEVEDPSIVDLDALAAAFRALRDVACASVDDDLAQCAEQGGAMVERARNPDGLEAALADLREMVAPLVAAYCDAGATGDADAAPNGTGARGAQPEPGAPAEPAQAMAPAAVRPGAPMDEEDELRDPEILAEFIIQSNEHLGEAEGHLLVLENDPANRNALSALFRGFHTVKGLAGFLAFPDVEVLAHAAEDLLTLAHDEGGDRLPEGGSDLVLETVDWLQRSMNAISEVTEARGEQPPPGLAAPGLIARINTLSENAKKASGPSAPDGAVGVETVGPSFLPTDEDGLDSGAPLPRGSPTPERSAPDDDNAGVASGPSKAGRARRETIRVDAERLDRLVDMVGELVITESMVTRGVGQTSAASNLGRHLTRMDKITRELHELAGSLRMVPVRGTFRKMARLARDVARKSGKRVSFQVHGDDAELDKTLVDRIGDPLVHMVRNAIDHGLEPDGETRVAAGKPPVGEVTLRALHRGGSVYIEVEDDGRGLNPDKIISRALERGLVRPGETICDRDIIRLICEPGFSTAEQVTSISGRGVGMDVVRQQIESMNGALDVTSELGKGTCFSMQLPLTLAVIDGMVMRIGSDRFVVPTLSVVRLVQPGQANVYTVLGKGEVLRVGESLIPLVRPQNLFELALSSDREPMAVVVEIDDGKVAMVVDELLGQQQVVIKSLGDGLGDIPGIAGCAILPDGRVGLVLDVNGIVRNRQSLPQEHLRDAG